MVISLLSSLLALAATSSTPPLPAVPAALVETVATSLQPSVSLTSRTATVYTYVHGEGLPSDSVVKNYVAQSIARFWDPTQFDSQVYTGGLYAAIDPLISRDYGGTEAPILIEHHLNEGVRVLNLVKYAHWPHAVQEALSQFGCRDLESLDSTLMEDKDLHCRAVALAVLKKLQVSLVSYFFDSIPPENCGSPLARDRNTIAFLVILPDALDASQMKILRSNPPQPDPSAADRTAIEQFARTNQTARSSGLDAMWPTPSGLTLSDADFSRWQHANLYGCAK